MEGENIKLSGKELNGWVDEMEEKLTSIRDRLDIMETEKEQMKEVWESEAGKLWLVGFRIHTNRMRRFTRRIKRQILELEELACELEGLENKLIAGAQRL
ncbi:MAG: hypothetical protein SOV61_13635 [Lachnospiraceae bacterium]|nr:hypothetical protein [Lachnospiraceae bacterium]